VALTKGHIREAIRELRRTHYERSRESKKWDVLDPETGRHLPPKLVLHRAYELAGTPRYPGGGWPTNNVLEAHGFTVVPKTQAALEEAEEQLEKLDDQALRAAALRGQKKVPPKVHMTVETVARSPAVSAYVKRLARGRCDLCQEPAPFRTRRGPYLECHHIQPLAKGGPDTIENTVALCPNCHRKMHCLNRSADRKALAARVAQRSQPGDPAQ
jgi:5-methylcytosine-specific restriction endonuclease McrA